MKQLTITLDDDVFNLLEVRAAIDDMRIKEAVETLLAELVGTYKKSKSVGI